MRPSGKYMHDIRITNTIAKSNALKYKNLNTFEQPQYGQQKAMQQLCTKTGG